jgi:hypothetical protein
MRAATASSGPRPVQGALAAHVQQVQHRGPHQRVAPVHLALDQLDHARGLGRRQVVQPAAQPRQGGAHHRHVVVGLQRGRPKGGQRGRRELGQLGAERVDQTFPDGQHGRQ